MIGFFSEKEFLNKRIEEVVKRFIVMDEKGKPIAFERLPGRKTLNKRTSQAKTVRFHSLNSKKEYWTHIESQPFDDEQNKFSGVINTFYDVTESKKREVANQFLNEMSKELSSALTYETRLKRFSELIMNNLAEGCLIDLIDNDGHLNPVTIDHTDSKKMEWLQRIQKKHFTSEMRRRELIDVMRSE